VSVPGLSSVMPAHSRPKDGVLTHAYVAGIHAFTTSQQARRGWHSKQTWMAGVNPAMTLRVNPAMTLRVNPAMTSGALHAGPSPFSSGR